MVAELHEFTTSQYIKERGQVHVPSELLQRYAKKSNNRTVLSDVLKDLGIDRGQY